MAQNNNLTKSKTEPGHSQSNIDFITVSYQPITQNAETIMPNTDYMLYTVGIIFKPNVKFYDFFLDTIETNGGKKVILTIATKINTLPYTPAHVFSYGSKPYIFSFVGNGQEFEIEDIVYNAENFEPANVESIQNFAISNPGKKKKKSVIIYTGPAIIESTNQNDLKKSKSQHKSNAIKKNNLKNNLTDKSIRTKKSNL